MKNLSKLSSLFAAALACMASSAYSSHKPTTFRFAQKLQKLYNMQKNNATTFQKIEHDYSEKARHGEFVGEEETLEMCEKLCDEHENNANKRIPLFEACVAEVATNPKIHKDAVIKDTIDCPYFTMKQNQNLYKAFNSYNLALMRCITKHGNKPKDCYQALIPWYGPVKQFIDEEDGYYAKFPKSIQEKFFSEEV